MPSVRSYSGVFTPPRAAAAWRLVTAPTIVWVRDTPDAERIRSSANVSTSLALELAITERLMRKEASSDSRERRYVTRASVTHEHAEMARNHSTMRFPIDSVTI